ncbi:uncharacterized protein Dana_GF21029, isoform C [Drosophila ananassae]|uniref:Uncharacterized protein, isoform C n=1 Tax=Drosophila ananassae TaxID=7217 RepID=A0A0N8NZR7_DROAN|nr:uncharacterized protein LOC6503718 isoform X2 [Drosophila ananassae]KPU75076.1 uncharacterized protein Dana_GF21029, isoform C [Drosophila ananassae]
MARSGLGLPMWMPLFILFLLFMASVWVMVNRQGLLDMYHQQVHGRGDLVCSKDGPKSHYKEKRADRTLNPFKAFLTWPGNRQLPHEHLGKYEGIEGQLTYAGENSPRSRMRERKLQEEMQPMVERKLEALMKRQDMALMKRQDMALDQGLQRPRNQARHAGMLRKLKGPHRRRLVNSPVMDFRREFASDEANPYVENLRQRFNPSPYD